MHIATFIIGRASPHLEEAYDASQPIAWVDWGGPPCRARSAEARPQPPAAGEPGGEGTSGGASPGGSSSYTVVVPAGSKTFRSSGQSPGR